MRRDEFLIWKKQKNNESLSAMEKLREDLAGRGLMHSGVRTKEEKELTDKYDAEIEQERLSMEEEERRVRWTKTKELVILSVNAILAVAAIVSSIFAVFTYKSTLEIRDDTRAIEKLDLAPEIFFQAKLYPTKTDSGTNIVPHFGIINRGPVTAMQVRVEFIIHEYDESSDSIKFSVSGGIDQNYRVDDIEPLETEAGLVDEKFLNVNARVAKPLENNILEARIIYTKDPDRRLFMKRAFYFINEEGKWVNENNSSLHDPKYKKMKEVLLENYRDFDTTIFGDILHSADF